MSSNMKQLKSGGWKIALFMVRCTDYSTMKWVMFQISLKTMQAFSLFHFNQISFRRICSFFSLLKKLLRIRLVQSVWIREVHFFRSCFVNEMLTIHIINNDIKITADKRNDSLFFSSILNAAYNNEYKTAFCAIIKFGP